MGSSGSPAMRREAGVLSRDELDLLCINTIRTLSNGRGPAGKLWPPWHADAYGPSDLLPLAAILAL
jgi:hypothetical protein